MKIAQKLQIQGKFACTWEIENENPVRIVVRGYGLPPRRIRTKVKVVDKCRCALIDETIERILNLLNQGVNVALIGDRSDSFAEDILRKVSSVTFIQNLEELHHLDLPDDTQIFTVPTLNSDIFNDFSEAIERRFPTATVIDTRCKKILNLESQLMELTQNCDAVIVVGAHNSANAQRLFRLSSDTGIPTFLIETEVDLKLLETLVFQKIGVIAAASTPNWIFNRVVDTLSASRTGSFIAGVSKNIFDFTLNLSTRVGFNISEQVKFMMRM